MLGVYDSVSQDKDLIQIYYEIVQDELLNKRLIGLSLWRWFEQTLTYSYPPTIL
jgi:hypothetical protein